MIIKDFRPSITEVAPIIEDIVLSGKKVRLTVTGYSMYPMLSHNVDTVTLEKADNIKKYDVILFRRKTGKYVLHRVISVRDGAFAIAGDNETKKEYPVYSNEAIAKVCSYERRGIEHSVSDKIYKLYSRVWLFVFPFRRIITRVFLRYMHTDEENDQ